jgi:predicted Zn-ribbon and HTH transcriptional regulator
VDGGHRQNVHLCGYRFQPVRDPTRFPVCPRCKELAAFLDD